MVTNKRSEPSDGELARSIQDGDSEAFEQLAQRYYRPVLALASAHLQEPADAEDAAQDTFLRVLDRIQMFDSRRPFAPWLYQVARNVARNFRRRSERQRGSPLTSVEGSARSSAPDPAEALERTEVRRLVAAAIEQLPPQQRTAFRLFEIERYSAAEVGEMMRVSPASARSNVYHARRALRSQLAAQLHDRSRE